MKTCFVFGSTFGPDTNKGLLTVRQLIVHSGKHGLLTSLRSPVVSGQHIKPREETQVRKLGTDSPVPKESRLIGCLSMGLHLLIHSSLPEPKKAESYEIKLNANTCLEAS